MKLSLSSCSATKYLTYGHTRSEVLQAIRDCGFSHIDLEITKQHLEGDIQQNAESLLQLLDKIGLTASMAHAPMLNPVKHREEALVLMQQSTKFCKHAGIPLLVVHPGAIANNTREEFFENNVAFYRALIPFAEKTGVTILIENIGNYADSYFLWNGKDLREMVDLVDHPLVAACWDIGHANHFFEKDCDQYSSIVALGDKLRAIHAHDNCGYITDTYKHSRLDMHTFPYFASPASVNWDAVLQGLKDIHYRGTFNFEVIAPAKSDRADFIYQGNVVNKLAIPSLAVWKAFNTALYQTGKYMLEAYDSFEG